MDNFYDGLDKKLAGLEGAQKAVLKKALERIKNTKVNVLLIGATSVGKSSTINALFDTSNINMQDRAVVGESANPQTMDTQCYKLNNVVIWDTPGLGDSAEKDRQHQEKITALLHRQDEHGQPLIDLVLLILDGGSKDFGSAYKLIKEIVAPNLANGDENRLLVAINKADTAMHHSFWDNSDNQPKTELLQFLEEQSVVVQSRIEADSGFKPDVIYYSAGYFHKGEVRQQPYNLAKLLSFMIDHLPSKKRIAVAADISKKKPNFESNDGKDNYPRKIEKSFLDSLKSFMSDASDWAMDVGVTVLKNNKELVVTTLTTALKVFFTKDKN